MTSLLEMAQLYDWFFKAQARISLETWLHLDN